MVSAAQKNAVRLSGLPVNEAGLFISDACGDGEAIGRPGHHETPASGQAAVRCPEAETVVLVRRQRGRCGQGLGG